MRSHKRAQIPRNNTEAFDTPTDDPISYNQRFHEAAELNDGASSGRIRTLILDIRDLPGDINQLVSEGREVLAEMKREGVDEFKEASLLQQIGLGATAATLALEWGTFNEGIIGVVGGNVLSDTHNAILAAGAAGSVSVAEQSIFGLTMVYSIRNFPRAIRAGREKIASISSGYSNGVAAEDNSMEPSIPDTVNEKREELTTPHKRTSRLLGRWATAFSIGSSLAVVKNNATEDRNPGENTKNVLIDSGLIGVSVVGLAGGIAEITNLGRSAGLEPEADFIVRVFSNPLTYAGLFGIHGFRQWRKRKNNHPQSTE